MPPTVLVYTLDAGGERSFDGSSELVGDVVPELRSIMAANGARLVEREQMVACGSPCAQFYRWGGVASLEIGLQREEIRNYGFHSVADWGFRRDLAPIRAALDADFALFVVLKQTRQTSGRKVLLALGGGYTIGKQIDVACIADLRDGRMTWCASDRNESTDLADRGRISAVVGRLLQGAFLLPQPTAPVSRP